LTLCSFGLEPILVDVWTWQAMGESGEGNVIRSFEGGFLVGKQIHACSKVGKKEKSPKIRISYAGFSLVEVIVETLDEEGEKLRRPTGERRERERERETVLGS